METLQYKVIKSDAQYYKYCDKLEKLVFEDKKSRSIQDKIELLSLLIDKYDEQRNSFEDLDPIQLLHALLKENELKAKDLVNLLSVSKGYVSDILHYKKGLSKEVIRKLASHFRLTQEAFNRPYKLNLTESVRINNSRAINKRKKRSVA